MIKRDWLIAAMILFFTGFYFLHNTDKLSYFYKKTFVSPFDSVGLKSRPVVRIRIKSGGGDFQKSYIADGVVDEVGRSVIFVDVPRDLVNDSELSNEMYVNEERVHVPMNGVTGNVVYLEYHNMRLYFIRDIYVPTMVRLMKENGFISSPGSI